MEPLTAGPDLARCGCCGAPMPFLNRDAALQHQWDRGHEEAHGDPR